MKEILLALWFAWQTVTAPFYPDPAVEVAKARTYLQAHLRIGHQLKPDLVRTLHAAGFQTRQFSPAAERRIRREKPWSNLPASRFYVCSKSIPGRPTISLTDVVATLALDDDDRILLSFVRVNRTYL